MKDEPIVGLTDSAMNDASIDLLDIAMPLAEHAKLLVCGPLLAGLLTLGITSAIPSTFTARTTFLPPQPQQSAATSAIASLGALSGLAGGLAGGLPSIKSPAEQHLALMQSATVADRMIDQFNLMAVYDKKYRIDARNELAGSTRLSIGKKDGLITIEVDDEDRQRAADMANRLVAELQRLTGQLALTEAQQRRVFFEGQLQVTRDRLTQAQLALQASGFSAGALKAEPKAAAEGYARLKGEATAAEVRLHALRKSLAEDTPEVQQQQGVLAALRVQLARTEQATQGEDGGPDYVGKYREFKYQETLFELFARQYEMARVDESREGSMIQVIDYALVPEKKSKPKRLIITLAATAGTLLLLVVGVITRHLWQQSAMRPGNAEKMARLRATLGKH